MEVWWPPHRRRPPLGAGSGRTRRASHRRRPGAAPRGHHHGRQPALGPGARPVRRRRAMPPASTPSGPSSSGPQSAASRCSRSTPSAARTGRAPATRSRRCSRCWSRPSATYTPDLVAQGVRVRLLGRMDELVDSHPRVDRGGARGHRRRHADDAQRRLQLLRSHRRSWTPCAAASADGLAPDDARRGRHRRAPLHGRPARARPAHPHRRRPAREQLPAVAERLRRALLLRPLLARLRPGTPSTRRWPSTRAAPAASVASPGPACASASSARPCWCPSWSCVFLLGNPWLTLGIAVLAVLAAYGGVRACCARPGFPVEPGVGGHRGAARGPRDWPAHDAPVGAGHRRFVAGGRRSSPPSTRSGGRTSATGFMAWVGSSFGALYVSLLAFVPASWCGRARRSRPAAARTAWLDAGRIWLLVLVLSRVELRHLRLPVGRTFKRGPLPEPHLAQQDLERRHRRHRGRDGRRRAL